WRYVAAKAEELCRLYGYERIDTPTFEETGVFERTNPGTDIVEKEMYTFEDRGGSRLTLRPEGTAPAARAYLEHGMRMLPQPVKLYYISPNFRYERPQAGRYRQHHQFGAEVFGEIDPSLDAEVIDLAWTFYRKLGISGVSLHVNSIGCPKCRPAYIERLVAYYRGRVAEVCGDCKRRLEVNPLRLLDCKVPTCQPVIERAPQIVEWLCEECRGHFSSLKGHLAALDIGYSINPRLVRGFDYYTKTVFEFFVQGIGAQNAIGAGGRYDGLIEDLGGPPTPGIGFGLGLERAVLTMQEQGVAVESGPGADVFVVAAGEAARGRVVGLVNALRGSGLAVASVYADRSLKAQMRAANASGARRVVILGEDEMKRGAAVVKDMETGSQEEAPLDRVVEYLKLKTEN
ncbi:histidine--tRNA ligase, partial [bacterium]|nr:histidine--tRNA ligase [bacterium]